MSTKNRIEKKSRARIRKTSLKKFLGSGLLEATLEKRPLRVNELLSTCLLDSKPS